MYKPTKTIQAVRPIAKPKLRPITTERIIPIIPIIPATHPYTPTVKMAINKEIKRYTGEAEEEEKEANEELKALYGMVVDDLEKSLVMNS